MLVALGGWGLGVSLILDLNHTVVHRGLEREEEEPGTLLGRHPSTELSRLYCVSGYMQDGSWVAGMPLSTTKYVTCVM